jgi:hypothetical protein
VALWHRTLDHAVDLLDVLPVEDRLALKVRAGEPLAAILCTSLFLRPPTTIGRDGGIDLAFDVDQSRCFDLFPPGHQLIEVKSVGHRFREHDAAIERRDAPRMHDEFTLVVERAADVVARMREPIARAAAKTATRSADGRHAFVIVHPLEHLAAEVVDGLIAARLPDMQAPEPLDAVWVLWFPDQLTVWSAARGDWTQVVFTARNEDEEADGDKDPLSRAEAEFLDRLPRRGGSPFQFRLEP